MQKGDFVRTMSRIVHSQGEEFRPFFEKAIELIKTECADEIQDTSSSQQMICTDYAYMIAKALQAKDSEKVKEKIQTLKTSLNLEKLLQGK